MLVQVKFTPNDPREKEDGTRYVDILCTTKNGNEINLYGAEGTADWDALHEVEKGQIIEVEEFQDGGNTFYRLTESAIDRILSGQKHIANVGEVEDPFEVLSLLNDLYEKCNRDLDERDLPIEPTAENVQKLTVTALMQVS